MSSSVYSNPNSSTKKTPGCLDEETDATERLNTSQGPSSLSINFFDPGEELQGRFLRHDVNPSLRIPKDLTQQRLLINLALIEDPELTSRSVNDEHVADVYKGISSNGFQEAMGLISVVEKPHHHIDDAANLPFVSHGRINTHVIIADGRHRRLVLLKLKEKSESSEWVKLASDLPVFLWSRKDGNHLSSMDILGLSAFLNAQSSNVRKPDFKDRIHASISAVKAIFAKRKLLNAVEVDPESVATEMIKFGTLGRIDRLEVYRYSQLGLRLARNDEQAGMFLKTAQECPKLSLTHVSSNVLLSLDPNGFQLGVESVCRRFQLPLQGSFRNLRKPFYTCYKKLYDFVCEAAQKSHVETKALLEMALPGTGKEKHSITIQESIQQQLLRFNLVQNQEISDQRRVTILQNRLAGLLDDASLISRPDPVTRKSNTITRKGSYSRTTRRRRNPASRRGRTVSRRRSAKTSEEDSKLEDCDYLLVSPQHSMDGRVGGNSSGHQRSTTDNGDTVPTVQGAQKQHEGPLNGRTQRVEMGIEPQQTFGTEVLPIYVKENICQRLRSSTFVQSIIEECLDEASGIRNQDNKCGLSNEDSSMVVDKPPCSILETGSFVDIEKENLENMASRRKVNEERVKQDEIERDTKRRRLSPATIDAGEESSRNFDAIKRSLRALKLAEQLQVISEVGFFVLSQRKELHDSVEVKSSSSQRIFEDHIPSELPLNVVDPSPYNGREKPDWCSFVTEVPSTWPAETPISHSHPWLHALFIPTEHRASVMVPDVSVLRYNHHFVFWRAALNVIEKHSNEILAISDSFGDPSSLSPNARKWAEAISNDELSLFYFGMKRHEVLEKGFCIMEGLLNDSGFPDVLGSFRIRKHGIHPNIFNSLEEEMMKNFSTRIPSTSNSVDKSQSEWETNTIDCDNPGGMGTKHSFHISTHYGITEAIERNENRGWCCKSRALLDIRICQAFAALRLWDNKAKEGNSMFIPRTGGRWVITTSECVREPLHTDFTPISRRDTHLGTGNPGYFAICTGRSELAIWVCPSSHKLVAGASVEKLRGLSYLTGHYLQMIPPCSIFIARGDLFHAEAGFKDISNGKTCLRYRLHLVPEEMSYTTDYNTLEYFNPIPRTSFECDSDDDSVHQSCSDQRTDQEENDVLEFRKIFKAHTSPQNQNDDVETPLSPFMSPPKPCQNELDDQNITFS